MDNYKISRLDDTDKKVQTYIKSIAKRAGVDVRDDMECYLMVDEETKPIAYTLFNIDNNRVYIDWIYSKKGYGTIFMNKLIKIFRQNADKIELSVSIDPNEKRDRVMRRINFYIKNNFRVFDIVYRGENGVSLSMRLPLR